MIQPVNNNPYTQSTPSSNPNRTQSVSGDASFSMRQALAEHSAAEDGVIYDHEPATERTEVPKNRTANQTASQAGGGAASSADQNIQGGEALPSFDFSAFFEKVKNFLSGFFAKAGEILNNFWESKPLTETKTEDAAAAKAETADSQAGISPTVSSDEELDDFDRAIEALEAEEDEAIKKALKEGDDASFKALLSHDGERVPARNTGVLTYYDHHGKIVKLDPSNEHRILHGDRGSRKT